MTTIGLYGGPLKRDIVQLAYEECGQAGYEFELTPEEYTSALRRLNGLMHEWVQMLGINLGYNFPINGTHGSPEDESGIPDGTMNTVGAYLAMRISPTIGKTMSAESRAALAMSLSSFRSAYATVPVMQLGRQTPRGAGNRLNMQGRPFFVTEVSADEIIQ